MKQAHQVLRIEENDEETVAHCRYLGNIITFQNDARKTVKHRIEIARNTYKKLFKLIRTMARKQRTRVLRATKNPVTIYGAES